MRSRRSSPVIVGIVATSTLLLSACGGPEEAASPTGADQTAADVMEPHEHSSYSFGRPADEDEADRVVEVDALDQLAFDPPGVDVGVGETITFAVTNTGAAEHEFVIGDDATHAEHAAEMEEMGEMTHEMGDEAYAVRLAPGDTKRITWHFPRAGQFEFACHLPGHYEGGMRGSVSVD